jgi:LytS/YehU family sensor histidine kinase
MSGGKGESTLLDRVQDSLKNITIFVLPVYVHFFLLDRFFYKKKYGIYALLMLLTLFGYAYLFNLTIAKVLNLRQGFVGLFTMIFLMLFVSTSIKVLADNIKQRFLLQEVKAQQIKMELNLLKAQINPHFLFNTLNNLFGMARKQNKNTADGIAGLSHLMRYMIYESDVERILLEKEVQQIKRMIKLQKLRFSPEDDIKVNLKTEGDFTNKSIPPMLLIPFVENAFKHGISLKAPSFVLIHLAAVSDNRLHFFISNSRHKRMGTDKINEPGIGLKNVRRRLEILYPGDHDLTIRETEEKYEVSLVLKKL